MNRYRQEQKLCSYIVASDSGGRNSLDVEPDEKALGIMERLALVAKVLGSGGGMEALLATAGADAKWRKRMLQLVRKAGIK